MSKKEDAVEQLKNCEDMHIWVKPIKDYIKELEAKEERAKKVEEFISLCYVETTDTGHEVVFWRDENYEYAKQLLKILKEELK